MSEASQSINSEDTPGTTNEVNIRDSTITALHLHANFSGALTSGEITTTPPTPTTPINNTEQPTTNFINSSTYNKIKEYVSNTGVSILHLYGMPGSGKSEIVRKLAAEFPTDDKGLVAKWHIACSDKCHDIKEQLESFMKAIYNNRLLPSETGLETAIKSMKDGRTTDYVSLLKNTQIPLLLIIEDPKVDDKALLEDFIKCVNKTVSEKKFHVYLTSTSKKIVNCDGLPMYKLENIEGFTMEEGLQMFTLSDESSQEERQAAKKIVEQLSFSPLGLAVVAAAKAGSYSFKDYLEHLQDDEIYPLVIDQEAKAAEKMKMKHLYQAITNVLFPWNNNENQVKNWKVLSALSLCHHGAIPNDLVERILQNFYEEKHEKRTKYLSRRDMESFIEHAQNFSLCKCDASTKTITFHDVVFSSVRSRIAQDNLLYPTYLTTLKALASIVHKDLRRSVHSKSMKAIVPHMQALVKQYQNLVNENMINPDDYLLKLCTSHLYEVIGVVMSNEQVPDEKISSAECNLNESLNLLCDLVRDLGFNITLEQLKPSTTNSEANCVAKAIVEACIKAGKTLSERKFNDNIFLSIMLHFRDEEFEFMRPLTDEKMLEYVKKADELNLQIPSTKLQNFRETNKNYFLNKDLYSMVMLTERFASVLHTMSRLIIYDNGKITKEKREQSKWFSTLTYTMCDTLLKQTTVASLFLHLSASSLVNVRLKALNDISDGKLNILKETRKYVYNELLGNQTPVCEWYEHGIKKDVKQQTFNKMQHYRSIVRINAKLVALDPEINLDEADQFCNKLYEEAKNNTAWGIWHQCIVYCGKYWAARGNYAKAAILIVEAIDFVIEGEHIKSYGWRCLNFARAVLAGNLVCHVPKVITCCEKALKSKTKMSKDIIAHLEQKLEAVKRL